MYFHDMASREAKELMDSVIARTFWGEKMLVAVVDLLADAVVPTHDHHHEQVGIILEGELEFTIGDQTRILKQGDVYTIPANVPHCARPVNGNARVMDVFSPVREEYKY